jgi:hypothetical protein
MTSASRQASDGTDRYDPAVRRAGLFAVIALAMVLAGSASASTRKRVQLHSLSLEVQPRRRAPLYG